MVLVFLSAGFQSEMGFQWDAEKLGFGLSSSKASLFPYNYSFNNV